MSYSSDQPNKDLRYAYVTAPRVYAAVYDAANPPTYNGANLVLLATAPTGGGAGGWIDCGVIATVSMPKTKNFTYMELGRPKTRRKTWEISRTSNVEFTIMELIPETMSLLMGFTSTNKVTGSATTCSGSPTRTTMTVASPTGISAGTRIAVSATALGCKTSSNRAVVSAVNGSDLTLAGTGFPVAPTSGQYVQVYTSIEMLDAMDVVSERSVIVFWDWVEDGQQRQVAVWYPRMSATAPFSPDFKDAANPTEMKVTLDALVTSQVVADGTTKLVDCIPFVFD